ncbi:MAG: glycosyltransferase, partial [Deltaproteobacteria bacterium]
MTISAMDALTRYLERHAEKFDESLPKPRLSTRLCVVIPALAESAEDVEHVLATIGPPGDTFEVIVVINRSEDAPVEVVEKNRRLSSALNRHPVIVLEKVFPSGTAGVGAARRTGMDLALRRLVASGRFEDGVIACLDADSPVSE